MFEWTKPTVEYLTTPKFTAFVNFLSILGFIVTIYVGLGIRKIRNQYAAKIRVPELKEQLQKHVSNLSGFLNDYANNINSIAIEIAQLEPVLQAIKKRLKWSERGKINKALKMLTNRQKYIQGNENGVRNIFNFLYGLISELEQWENDKNVE